MNSFLIYLVESGICLGLFYIIYRIFLSRETFFRTNRLYLLFAIPLSFIIPLINIPSPFLTAKKMGIGSMSTQGTVGAGHSFGLTEIVGIVYLFGALFFLVCFGYKLAQLAKLIHKYGYQKCGKLKIVYIEQDTAPFSFFNYFFLYVYCNTPLVRFQHRTVDLLRFSDKGRLFWEPFPNQGIWFDWLSPRPES